VHDFHDVVSYHAGRTIILKRSCRIPQPHEGAYSTPSSNYSSPTLSVPGTPKSNRSWRNICKGSLHKKLHKQANRSSAKVHLSNILK
jgi:hypothetical protein